MPYGDTLAMAEWWIAAYFAGLHRNVVLYGQLMIVTPRRRRKSGTCARWTKVAGPGIIGSVHWRQKPGIARPAPTSVLPGHCPRACPVDRPACPLDRGQD